VINWWAECIPFRLWLVSNNIDGDVIKIMSFNIDGSTGEIHTKAPRIASLIESYSPDVVFITEFSEEDRLALDTLLAKKYIYSTLNKKGRFNYFYSKYPLFDDNRLRDSLTNKRINIYSCKTIIKKDTIVLYGCHLPSNNYTSELKSLHPDNIEDSNDLLVYMNNVNCAYDLRAQQVESLVKNIEGTNSPVIVMGDMNDVGGSASIRRIESCGLKDAWWEGGCGYGATIHKPLAYRIDHIFYSYELRLNNIKVVDSEGVSDHDALYAEFELMRRK
jgi:endonuclease/exonuclease/phosphatase (EEP) superfamily protein YafD